MLYFFTIEIERSAPLKEILNKRITYFLLLDAANLQGAILKPTSGLRYHLLEFQETFIGCHFIYASRIKYFTFSQKTKT
jgi:hypothetical protein